MPCRGFGRISETNLPVMESVNKSYSSWNIQMANYSVGRLREIRLNGAFACRTSCSILCIAHIWNIIWRTSFQIFGPIEPTIQNYMPAYRYETRTRTASRLLMTLKSNSVRESKQYSTQQGHIVPLFSYDFLLPSWPEKFKESTPNLCDTVRAQAVDG